MTAVRIIGIGSAFGDDRIGWDAIEALRAAPLPVHAELHRIGAPAAELMPLLLGADRVILIDALASGDPPGHVLRCDPRALARADGDLSGHGLSVDMVLDLAETLGELPRELTLIGVAIDAGAARTDARMSPAVAAALPEIVAAVTCAACAKGVPA